MSTALGVAAFIVMLLLVVLIHEAAHFGFAKLFGFKVEEYFVGFGKRLWSVRRGETEYGLKAIPAGGYVKIAGMDPFRPVAPSDPDFPRTYYEKPAWQRAIVIAAGPLTHFVIAFIFFSIALTFAGGLFPSESVTFPTVEQTFAAPLPPGDLSAMAGDRVVLVVAGSASVAHPSEAGFQRFVREHQGEELLLVLERQQGETTERVETVVAASVLATPSDVAGLRRGDRVVEVASGPDRVSEPSANVFVEFVGEHQRDALELVIERDGEVIETTLQPVLVPSPGVDEVQMQWRIGVELSESVVEKSGFPQSLSDGAQMVWLATQDSVREAARIFGPEGIGRMRDLLFTDAEREVTDPASAIGLAGAAGTLSEGGRFFQLLFLFGAINVFVGLLNLLPLPPFDGGHLAVLVIEKIRGKRVDVRRLVPVAAVVLTFFVLFTSAAVLVDITKPLQLGP
ncbi:MAG: RIP metalloprotease RseP [Actinomycetota bacterium]